MQELHPRIYVRCLAAYNNGQLHGDSLPKLATEAAARSAARAPPRPPRASMAAAPPASSRSRTCFPSCERPFAARSATAPRKGGGTPPALYVPGSATLDGFQGRVALHALEIANGDAMGEAHGYRLEFWSTASAATKGGVLDLQAQVEGPLFTVAAGPFAAKLPSARAGDRFAWTRNGVEFAVRMEGPGAPRRRLRRRPLRPHRGAR